jgi:DNA topoisomerase-1
MLLDPNTSSDNVVDPRDAAETAGLSYVSDEEPGIRRKKSGKGFAYVGPGGKKVEDKPTLERIRSLAIPPAYTDVWICARPNGHIQATGRDAKGRKQYRYHPAFREVRESTKYEHMIEFAKGLPAIRRTVDRHMSLPACRGRRCWPPWCTCSKTPSSAWATPTTPSRTRATASPPFAIRT